MSLNTIVNTNITTFAQNVNVSIKNKIYIEIITQQTFTVGLMKTGKELFN